MLAVKGSWVIMRLVRLECCITLSYIDAVRERNNPTFNGVKLNLNQLNSMFQKII
jgi:hypothetical protein